VSFAPIDIRRAAVPLEAFSIEIYPMMPVPFET